MKILAVQNRMGIGDMIIFLPFIEAISKKFGCPVSILVKENTKSSEILIGTRWNDVFIKLIHEESQTEIGAWNNIKDPKYLINFPTQERCDAFREFKFASSIKKEWCF